MAVKTRADGSAVARVYEDIKRRILGGELRLRERVGIDDLAALYKVSATPVRQALAQLSLEQLVVAHPTRGHHVALWSEQALRELYEWRGMLAGLAARTYEPAEGSARLNGASTYADAVAQLFQRLHAGANPELAQAATNADERLHAARLVEPVFISTCEAELGALADEMRHGTPQTLQAALWAYHRRRAESAASIRAHAILRSLPVAKPLRLVHHDDLRR